MNETEFQKIVAERNRLRAVLVLLVGEDDAAELVKMRDFIAKMAPAAESPSILPAIDALIEIRPDNGA